MMCIRALALSAFSATLCAALLGGGPLLAQVVFRSETRIVPVYATVQDRTGRLVTDLPRDAFQVRDNGRPVELAVFSSDPPPLVVALLIDTSGSMAPRFTAVREAALAFVHALRPDDRVRIGTFGFEIGMSPHLTTDRRLLARVIREEIWLGGASPLWTGLEAAMDSLATEVGRRVVLVLTDDVGIGTTDIEQIVRPRVEQRAVDEAFMVYAMGFQGTYLHRPLAQLAEQTGGGHFIVSTAAHLPETFARISEELRHQYLLGFVPRELDGRRHSISVTLRERGLRVRATQEYLAVARQP